MKRINYGLILGLILAVIVFLSNVVFPNNSPDWAPGELMVATIIGVYVVLAAWHSIGKREKPLIVGAITSLLGFSFSMVAFFIVDNLFLNIVSRQSDKITGFANSHASSMRAYINTGLLRGLIIGLPASIAFGLMCGWVGSIIAGKYPPQAKSLST